MKILLTGPTGFIGSAFVRLALDEGLRSEVTNFDALTYAGNTDNLAEMDAEGYRFVHGDITDRDSHVVACYLTVAGRGTDTTVGGLYALYRGSARTLTAPTTNLTCTTRSQPGSEPAAHVHPRIPSACHN